MSIRQEFGEALAGEWARDGEQPELLPVQLARAAATSLGVDGVGLSFHDAAGSGPCMFAAQSGWPVFALDAVEALCVAWTESTGTEGPPWTNGEPARHRARVWIATGMVILALQPETADALAVLRSHAYSSDAPSTPSPRTSSPAGSPPAG